MSPFSTIMRTPTPPQLIAKTISALLALQACLPAFAGELSVSNGWVKCVWEEKSGAYHIVCRDPNWEFAGKLPSSSAPATQTQGV